MVRLIKTIHNKAAGEVNTAAYRHFTRPTPSWPRPALTHGYVEDVHKTRTQLEAVSSSPSNDRPPMPLGNAPHAPNGVDDLRMTDGLQHGDIAGAVSIGIALSQIHVLLCGKGFDQNAFAFAV